MSGWLRVDSEGAITVDEAAGAQLARSPGTFQLARTAADLLVAVRQAESEPQPLVGRIAFCGDLDGLPFADVVILLAQSRRSGLLHVVSGPDQRVLVFSDGALVAASSTHAGERLGEVALGLGLLDREDLVELLSTPAEGRRIGDQLVERGLLDREGLERAVREQITAVFEAILVRPVGSFFFRDHPVAPGRMATALGVQGLLLDGLRRLDEWAHYRTRIPSVQTQVRAGPNLPAEADGDTGAIVELVRAGPTTAADLARTLRLPELQVMRALFHLVEEEGIEVLADQKTRPLAELGSDPAPLREMLRAFNRIFGEIFTEVTMGGEGAGFADEAAGVLGSQPLLAGLRFYPDGSLPVGEILVRLPEAAQHAGKGPRALLLETLQPVLSHLIEAAEKRIDTRARDDLHARLRLLVGMSEW